MEVKRFDVVNPKTYTKDGQEKTAWQNVGNITLFTKEDGTVSGLCEIYAFNNEFKVFEQKPRNTVATNNSPSEEIKPEDIPF